MPAAETVRFEWVVTVEERDGYFAASTEPFAVTVYGDTAEAAEERALRAVTMMLKKHTTEPGGLHQYLNKVGVMHVVDFEDDKPLQARVVKRQLEFATV